MGDFLGVRWRRERISPQELARGMNVELEHGLVDPRTNVTCDDPVLTGKIALAHLRERPDYYERLEEAEEAPKARRDAQKGDGHLRRGRDDPLHETVEDLLTNAASELVDGGLLTSHEADRLLTERATKYLVGAVRYVFSEYAPPYRYQGLLDQVVSTIPEVVGYSEFYPPEGSRREHQKKRRAAIWIGTMFADTFAPKRSRRLVMSSSLKRRRLS